MTGNKSVNKFSKDPAAVKVAHGHGVKYKCAPSKNKFYVVVKGRTPGIYATWAECQIHVNKFSGAVYKGFKTHQDAVNYQNLHTAHISSKETDPIGNGVKGENCELDIRRISGKFHRSVTTNTKSDSDTNGTKLTVHIDSEMLKNNSNLSIHIKSDKTHMKIDKTSSISAMSIHISFDGGARGNPSKIAGGGAVVTIGTSQVSQKEQRTQTALNPNPSPTISYHIRQYLGNNNVIFTNNQAEYSALLTALRVAVWHIEQQQQRLPDTRFTIHSLHIQGDSQLIINHMNDVYSCKSEKLLSYFNECKELIRKLKLFSLSNSTVDNHTGMATLIEHVYRNQNKVADALANEAMDKRRSYMTRSDDNHQKQYTTIEY